MVWWVAVEAGRESGGARGVCNVILTWMGLRKGGSQPAAWKLMVAFPDMVWRALRDGRTLKVTTPNCCLEINVHRFPRWEL